MRLQVKSDGSVLDPAEQSYVLEQVSHKTCLKFCEILFFSSLVNFLLFSNIFVPFIHSWFWGEKYFFSYWIDLQNPDSDPQIKQKLKDSVMLENTTVTWTVQPDGTIFHKKKKDGL